jgi:hypothetical protein
MSVKHNVVVGFIALACLGTGAAFAEAAGGDEREPLYALSVWSREDFEADYGPTFGPHVGTKQEVDRAALAARKKNPRRTNPEVDAVIFACRMHATYDGLLDPSPSLTDAEFARDCTEY